MQIKMHYLKKVCSWLLPFTCILCARPSERNQDLCGSCYQTLPRLEQGCLCCAIPLAIGFNELCGQCLQKKPPFDATHALFSYESPIIQLILELKFNQSIINARVLGELLTAQLTEWYKNKPLPAIIIPMPLHPTRLKERGFNQALEIARPAAKMLNLPLDTMHCQRVKLTTPQTTLSAIERQKNVKGAFKVNENFAGQHIAIVDDVITTGSTMTEFCRMLKQHGAQKIDVWCCARACV